MKFDKILARKWDNISEQGEEQMQPMEEPMPVQGGPADATQPQPGAEPEMASQEPATLSPEAEVMYVRLIKKALVLNIDPEDVDSMAELHDINPDNAKEAAHILMELMKKYGTQLEDI